MGRTRKDRLSNLNVRSDFVESLEEDIEETVKHNAEVITSQDSARQTDAGWIDATAKHLQDKYNRQQRSGPQSTKESLVYEGSITYLARKPSNASGDEDDVQHHCYALSLENPAKTKKSLVAAQTQWDEAMKRKFGEANRLTTVR